MVSTLPVESYEDIAERFSGIIERDPLALGRLAFHLASHEPNNAYIMFEDSEMSEDWHYCVRDVLRHVDTWRREISPTSRLEMAQELVRKRQQKILEDNLKKSIESGDPDIAY